MAQAPVVAAVPYRTVLFDTTEPAVVATTPMLVGLAKHIVLLRTVAAPSARSPAPGTPVGIWTPRCIVVCRLITTLFSTTMPGAEPAQMPQLPALMTVLPRTVKLRNH